MANPNVDKPFPNLSPIDGGKLALGSVVKIQGRVPSTAYRFDINLLCCPEDLPQSDIALQLSVHILERCVKLNSFQNGVWGEEKCHTTLPFKRAEAFSVVLLCEYDQYKISVNGQNYCEFPHRIQYHCVTHVGIEGDVSVTSVSYQTTPGGFANLDVKQNETHDFEMIDSSEIPPRRQPPLQAPCPSPYTQEILHNKSVFPYNTAINEEIIPLNATTYSDGRFVADVHVPLNVSQITSLPVEPRQEYPHSVETITDASKAGVLERNSVTTYERPTPASLTFTELVMEKIKTILILLFIIIVIILVIYLELFHRGPFFKISLQDNDKHLVQRGIPAINTISSYNSSGY